MKNKTKKILSCAMLMLVIMVGTLFMTGCSMTAEQQNALNVITKNTETLVDSFSSYLEGQNKKLDKEAAYDMLRETSMGRLCNVIKDSVMQVNVSGSSLYPQHDPSHDIKAKTIYDFTSDNKKMMTVNDNPLYTSPVTVLNYNAEDATKNYRVDINDNDQFSINILNDSMIEKFFTSFDITSLAGGIITMENITSFNVDENGEYTLNIMKTHAEETPRTGYFRQYTYIIKIVIKDYKFKSIDIQTYTTDDINIVHNPFLKDINGNYVEDGYGSYAFTLGGALNSVNHMKYEFKYGSEVSLTDLNEKVADIEEKIESGELVMPIKCSNCGLLIRDTEVEKCPNCSTNLK